MPHRIYKSKLISAPSVTTITLAEAKEALAVQHTVQDAFITDLIGYATDWAEIRTRRKFITALRMRKLNTILIS